MAPLRAWSCREPRLGVDILDAAELRDRMLERVIKVD
jgi:hypothetical protein